MSVWKDKAGRYHVAVQRGGSRVHRICPPAATWRDAKRKEAELEQRFQAVTTGKVLIADAIQHWLKTEVAHQKASKGTEGNAYALAEWVKGRTLDQVGKVAEDYIQARRGEITNSTINRRLAVLRRVATLAYRRWGWLDNPAGDRIQFLPENAARERFLTRSELAVLLRGIPNRSMRKAALVAAFTGLRRGELARLRPVNVQADLIWLHTTKSGRPRTVPVVHHVLFALRRLLLAYILTPSLTQSSEPCQEHASTISDTPPPLSSSTLESTYTGSAQSLGTAIFGPLSDTPTSPLAIYGKPYPL
jgi:integrase